MLVLQIHSAIWVSKNRGRISCNFLILGVSMLHEITCCLLLCEISPSLASLLGRVSMVELGPWQAG